MGERLILQCEDSLEGIFTALYEAFEYRNQMVTTLTTGQITQSGRVEDADVRRLAAEQISIRIGEGKEQDLFAREIMVRTERGRAEKTIHAIQKKLGYMVYQTLVRALCHFDEDRGTVVFRYLVRGFQKGRWITEYLADPYVMRVMELSRKVEREREKLYGFLRFRDAGKFLYANIAPKCNVIPIMMEHFTDRYPGENFIIYDERRRYALLHPAYRECFYITGEELKIDSDAITDEYEVLWKQYFQAMEIKERHNEKCQNNNLPKWYRNNMVEFAE